MAKVRPFLNQLDAEKLVHAFISSRLDYCNALLTGLSKKSINRLQLIQNTAARILTKTKKREHITPVLRALHWLPVSFRIDFKILLLVFKAHNGIAPLYISECLSLYVPPRALQSSTAGLLTAPKVKFVKSGMASFSFYATKLWNVLPENIKKAESVVIFKKLLKTHLFTLAFS